MCVEKCFWSHGIQSGNMYVLQGKEPLINVFADTPIKIAQKSVYSGGEWEKILVDVFVRCVYKYIMHRCILYN